MLSLDENHFEKSIFTLTRYDKSLLKYYLHLKEKINYDSKNFIPKSVSLGSAAVATDPDPARDRASFPYLANKRLREIPFWEKKKNQSGQLERKRERERRALSTTESIPN